MFSNFLFNISISNLNHKNHKFFFYQFYLFDFWIAEMRWQWTCLKSARAVSFETVQFYGRYDGGENVC